jgi:hypothetical protein
MFLLNGNPLAVDTAFTNDGIQYPANWLRLATEAEKSAIGITEVADAVRADDRFYWDGNLANPKALEDVLATDEDGNQLYVKVLDKTDPDNPQMVDSDKPLITRGLKYQFIQQVKATAGSILAQTDWLITRKVERDVAIPAEVVAYRASVVAKATELEASISAVTTLEELASLDLSFPQAE